MLDRVGHWEKVMLVVDVVVDTYTFLGSVVQDAEVLTFVSLVD